MNIDCLNNINLAISILMSIIVIRTIYVIKFKMPRKHIIVKSLKIVKMIPEKLGKL